MSKFLGGEDGEQWLVSAEGQLLSEVIESLRTRPDVQVIRIIGTDTSPRLAVIGAAASTVTALQAAFGDRVVISPDKPLELFSGSAGGSNFPGDTQRLSDITI
ncbi:hypothetical protein AMS62_27765 [Bacillus sp. FJAT-18019]|nr:hypothetical protein AMS62_27765 [Bacillus sp. FJAT-18019]